MTLIAPKGRRLAWRARYTDQDSGRMAWESLPADLTTTELRDAWAVAKSKALAKRRLELEGGATRASGVRLSDAIASYYRAHPALRAKTLAAYKGGTDKLLGWAERQGLRSCDELTRAKLMLFRAEVVSAPKHTSAKGVKRGTRKPTEKRRSPYSINRELVAVGTVLRYLCDADHFARLTHDDLRRALKKEAVVTAAAIDYRKPAELRALLSVALKHDAETFDETREEHRGRRARGTTPRHKPIAPFVVGALLIGARASELLALDWQDVDLDTGEIRIHRTASVTKRARVADLRAHAEITERILRRTRLQIV